jgi:coenzyme F420-dependent glucose-6-phosphate dehydrogenase
LCRVPANAKRFTRTTLRKVPIVTEIGYTLSSEEHRPDVLVRNARAAEQAGFAYALISDHYHPWVDRQGQSPFVWSVIGAIAQATDSLRLGTGVTCPTIRIHPAVIAQAAATSASMLPGRFFLGVGTGENLNEHILGDRWPGVDERQELLEEALEIMRELWQGGLVTRNGGAYTVDRARVYTLPDEPPPIYVAAAGPESAELAARIGEGLISTAPDEEVVQTYERAGGRGPRFGQLHVCYGEDEAAARKLAHEIWPNAALHGTLGQELPVPSHYEQAVAMVTEDDVAEVVPCGADPERHLEAIREYERAGFDHVYVHQIGPDQHGFLRFYREQILPRF